MMPRIESQVSDYVHDTLLVPSHSISQVQNVCYYLTVSLFSAVPIVIHKWNPLPQMARQEKSGKSLRTLNKFIQTTVLAKKKKKPKNPPTLTVQAHFSVKTFTAQTRINDQCLLEDQFNSCALSKNPTSQLSQCFKNAPQRGE